MPVPFEATTIKSWYQTGDQPTQQQFADWIDTMFYQISSMQNTIDELVAATAADTRRPIAGGHFIAGNPCTVISLFGVSSIVRVGQTGASPNILQNIHVNFTVPFADEFYQAQFYIVGPNGTNIVEFAFLSDVAEQTAGYCFVKFTTGTHVSFFIYRP